MTTRRKLLAGAGLGVLAGALGAHRAFAQARAAAPAKSPPPLEMLDFYLAPFTASAALSPSGKRVAVLRNRYTDAGIVAWVDLIDTANPAAPPRSLKLGAHEASLVDWANETRLLVWMVYDVTRKGYETEYITRVIALDDDGGAPAILFGNRGTSLEYIHSLGAVIDSLPDDLNHVLMEAWEPLRGLPALYKVDVNSGDAVVLEYGAPRTTNWLTQNGVAMVRVDEENSAASRIMIRERGAADWKLMQVRRNDQDRESDIFGASETPGVFYGAARLPGEDKISLRELDLATLKWGPPIVTPDKSDVEVVHLDQRNRHVWTSWVEDRRAYEFTDKTFAPHFSAIEKYFGPDLSVTLQEVDDARARYLGVASGPREPGIYFLYDRASHAVAELGAAHPHLSGARLGAVHSLAVKTRDGVQIRAYLTQPASGAPGPLIVMPHGGPEVRDEWGFDGWPQILAAQGWWVLQPNFRGSGGYGLDFARQGWRHWGDRMQEDVEDATAQAVSQFKLDASQVAIFGASYGGYAALMGAVRKPDLYKAVVSMDGVSDLLEQLKWERSQDPSSEKYLYEFWRKRIGDPATDEAMLIQASPRRRTAEIKAPVFLMHGFLDDVVPMEQSRMMAKALTAAGKKVELWEIPKEGHSPSTRRRDRERLERVIAFLKPLLA